MPPQTQHQVKTYNDSAQFIAEVLHPLLVDYKNYSAQTAYGAHNINDARMKSKEQKDYERFNGLKACAQINKDIYVLVSSTIFLSKVEKDKKHLVEINEENQKIIIFLEKRHKSFFSYDALTGDENLILDKLNKFKDFIDNCHIKIQKLLTKHKLLFTTEESLYKDDQQLLEELKKEYVER